LGLGGVSLRSEVFFHSNTKPLTAFRTVRPMLFTLPTASPVSSMFTLPSAIPISLLFQLQVRYVAVAGGGTLQTPDTNEIYTMTECSWCGIQWFISRGRLMRKHGFHYQGWCIGSSAGCKLRIFNSDKQYKWFSSGLVRALLGHQQESGARGRVGYYCLFYWVISRSLGHAAVWGIIAYSNYCLFYCRGHALDASGPYDHLLLLIFLLILF